MLCSALAHQLAPEAEAQGPAYPGLVRPRTVPRGRCADRSPRDARTHALACDEYCGPSYVNPWPGRASVCRGSFFFLDRSSPALTLSTPWHVPTPR